MCTSFFGFIRGLHKYQTARHWNRTADCWFPPFAKPRDHRPRTRSNDVGGQRGGSGHQLVQTSEAAVLVHGQRRLCTRNIELMSAVAQASHMTIEVCQAVFNDNRWNCSSVLNAPNFSPDVTSGTSQLPLLRCPWFATPPSLYIGQLFSHFHARYIKLRILRFHIVE